MGGKTTIEQAPTTPAPSAQESAEDIYKARLQYDPLVAEQEFGIQSQYVPLQTALYNQLFQQYYPQLAQSQRTLQEQLFPRQSRILEAGAGRALSGLESPYQQALQAGAEATTLNRLQQPISAISQLAELEALRGTQPTTLEQALQQEAIRGLTPTGLTSEQQSAIDAIRNREMERTRRNILEAANVGGGLYGGRTEQRVERGLGELAQAFAQEDVNRALANRQAAMAQALGVGQFGLAQRQQGLGGLLQVTGQQEQARQQALQNAMAAQEFARTGALPYMQILYPQIGQQQPQISPYQFTSAVPNANQLYQAMFQASQPEYFAQQGTDYLSQLLGIGGGLGTARILAMSSKRYKKNIKLWGKPSTYLQN